MTKEIELLIAELDQILESERTALMSGKLDVLSGMAAEKEALMGAIDLTKVDDPEALKHLIEKVKRNQGLLNNALEGIRKVARRMAAFRRVQGSLETYDRNGEKRVVSMTPISSVERRA
jgi:flagellar biosynthesis/type III secretory pathway chaperone